MLIIKKTPFISRRKPPRVAPAVPSGLLIASVTITADPWIVRVTFSGPMVWNGMDVPSEFRVMIGGIMESCIGVSASGADWIEVENLADVDPGAAWDVNAAMSGITPVVASPQSGVVA